MAKPIVAIVGRPNVGKSTLFNIFANSRISIVEDTPGVTRDRLYATAEWLDHEFMMVDTGGIEIETDDAIVVSIREQAQIAIKEADVIVFVVDCRAGMMKDDEEVGRMLLKSGKPVIVCANKADSPKQEMEGAEFWGLGFDTVCFVSASNHTGLGDLLDEVVAHFPDQSTLGQDEEDEITVQSLEEAYNVQQEQGPKKCIQELNAENQNQKQAHSHYQVKILLLPQDQELWLYQVFPQVQQQACFHHNS